jgi:hypothetical protein
MEKFTSPSTNKSIEFTQTDGTLTVVLSGNYPWQEALSFWEKELQPQLEETVEQKDWGDIIIDVTQIESFSRYGLNFIRFLIDKWYHITIKNPNKQFQNMLRHTKANMLTKYITIMPQINTQESLSTILKSA